MKKGYLLVWALVILFVASCSPKKEEAKADDAVVEWKELDSFHMLMAEVFHPLKDSGNVEPATRLMGQLADEAEKWAAAPLPEKVNNDEVKAKIEKLKVDTRAFASEISTITDPAVIGTRLHGVHDLFHEIQEAWYKGGSGEHDEHKEHH